MSATTPLDSSIKRSSSRNRHPNSRPTTPLRPSSRSSLRDSHRSNNGATSEAPLDVFEPAFAELSDSMADLEANFMHLQLMHESLARFSESFASFLYGLNMNAFCVDFPEAPTPESFRRSRAEEDNNRLGNSLNSERYHADIDGETTFMTTDTSFVENPPMASRVTPKKFSTPAPSSRGSASSGRGGSSARGGTTRGGARGTRGSGLARAKPRGMTR